MATINKNLSAYNIEDIPNAKSFRFGIVVSEWNNNITSNLLKGAYETLVKHQAEENNIIVQYVPGSFELPLGAQLLLEKHPLDAVICLGSVIQGETKHFDFVCQATALGIKDVSLKYNTPRPS
jgi:6,7-dimethyl-8-ribityllumazine synthase